MPTLLSINDVSVMQLNRRFELDASESQEEYIIACDADYKIRQENVMKKSCTKAKGFIYWLSFISKDSKKSLISDINPVFLDPINILNIPSIPLTKGLLVKKNTNKYINTK